MAGYVPYEKQRQFHDAGALHRERLFMAGNQLGKTTAGAMEATFHATGLYPDWWNGRRFLYRIQSSVVGRYQHQRKRPDEIAEHDH